MDKLDIIQNRTHAVLRSWDNIFLQIFLSLMIDLKFWLCQLLIRAERAAVYETNLQPCPVEIVSIHLVTETVSRNLLPIPKPILSTPHLPAFQICLRRRDRFLTGLLSLPSLPRFHNIAIFVYSLVQILLPNRYPNLPVFSLLPKDVWLFIAIFDYLQPKKLMVDLEGKKVVP